MNEGMVTVRVTVASSHGTKEVNLDMTSVSAREFVALGIGTDEFSGWDITEVRMVSGEVASGYLLLDADQAGHLATVVKDYLQYHKEHIEDFLEGDDTDDRVAKPVAFAELFYLAGWLAARVMFGTVREKDLQVIEAWEEELEILKDGGF